MQKAYKGWGVVMKENEENGSGKSHLISLKSS